MQTRGVPQHIELAMAILCWWLELSNFLSKERYSKQCSREANLLVARVV